MAHHLRYFLTTSSIPVMMPWDNEDIEVKYLIVHYYEVIIAHHYEDKNLD